MAISELIETRPIEIEVQRKLSDEQRALYKRIQQVITAVNFKDKSGYKYPNLRQRLEDITGTGEGLDDTVRGICSGDITAPTFNKALIVEAQDISWRYQPYRPEDDPIRYEPLSLRDVKNGIVDKLNEVRVMDIAGVITNYRDPDTREFIYRQYEELATRARRIELANQAAKKLSKSIF